MPKMRYLGCIFRVAIPGGIGFSDRSPFHITNRIQPTLTVEIQLKDAQVLGHYFGLGTCIITFTTIPFGSRTKNRRTPHGSSVSG